ncbi:hypothetical protein C8J56DRAFT_263451 [Mycena floridula]|nr:hypothetical protein C8J56DRAFT_263451 [Mycena floridula]
MNLISRNHWAWTLFIILATAKKGDGSGENSDDDSPVSSTQPSSIHFATTSTASPSKSAPVVESTDPVTTSTSQRPAASPGIDPLPSIPLTFQFTAPNNTTTCDSTTFFWSSGGVKSGTMDLVVFNNISNRPLPFLAINETVAKNVTSSTQEWTWLSVNVPEGWYAVQALESSLPDGVSLPSAPFFVQNGSDVSCLVGKSTASEPDPMVPSSPKPKHRHVHIGSLLGTVIGSLVAFVVIAIAFIYPRWWRRALPSPKIKRRYVLY